jgi:predicted O-methyltransferase YrrM
MNPKDYSNNPHWRHSWWHRTQGEYLPQVYMAMTPGEQAIFDRWYEETTRDQLIGEMHIPLACLLSGLISGSNVRHIVQLGHYSGYSTLVLGMCLRHMRANHALWSVDICPDLTAYTQKWVNEAGLQDVVKLHTADSVDSGNPRLAIGYLREMPSLVFIDSSHQYQHTLDELAIWWKTLKPGGMLVLHDVSDFAKQFDSTGQGGVIRALTEWLPGMSLEYRCLLANGIAPGYMDICGVGLIQKPLNT